MRHFYLATLFTFSTSIAFAQSSQLKIANNSLGKLQLSINEKADVKKQLAIIGEGIKAIDVAEKDKRTRNWPETWAIKTYLSSYVAIIDDNNANAEKYFQIAQEALDRATKLDKFQSNGDLINAATQNIHVKLLKDGNQAFEQNDFENAFEMLKKVSDYKPKDTTLATNVALCAQNIQQYNDALIYYTRAKDNGIKNPAVFQQLANIYASKFETDLAIKMLEDGLKVNQYQSYLLNDYINLLLDVEQYDKAYTAIESSLNAETRNRTLYFLYGYLQQQKNNNSIAEIAYKKALEIDQNYFDALYQLGIAFIQSANNALAKSDTRNFNSNINRAEYALLSAHEINVNHLNTVKLLIEIYTRKNKLDKVQELKRKLNEY